jgi:hypothetical protein
MHASSAPSNNGDVQLLQNSGDFKVQNPVHSEQVTANAQALPFQEVRDCFDIFVRRDVEMLLVTIFP